MSLQNPPALEGDQSASQLKIQRKIRAVCSAQGSRVRVPWLVEEGAPLYFQGRALAWWRFVLTENQGRKGEAAKPFQSEGEKHASLLLECLPSTLLRIENVHAEGVAKAELFVL